MTAVVQERYGDPDRVLGLEQVPRPTAEGDRVLVRVRAAAVSGTHWHLLRGLPYLARPVTGWTRPRDTVPGLELAGTVEAVGEAVTRFRPGDAVYGWGAGAMAEYAAVPEGQLAPSPASLTLEEAAVVPIAFFTAIQAVHDRAGVGAGDRVLVTGASGGVGTYVVQVAKSLGAEVTAVCSAAKADLVRSLGADHVVDYRRESIADRAGHYDVLIDLYGNPTLRDCARALRPGGTLVFVGGTGGPWAMGVDRWVRGVLAAPFLRLRALPLVHKDRLADLHTAGQLVEAGVVRPVLDRTFRPSEVAEAIEYVRQGRARGQVAVVLEGPADGAG
jgi:NADPH:quinone reductase-like Zn-dependent oxidoreductase